MINLLSIAASAAGMAASECVAAPPTIDPPVGVKFVYELDDPNTRGFQLAQTIMETRGVTTRISQSIIHRQGTETNEIAEPENRLTKFRGVLGLTAETPRYRHALRVQGNLAASLSGIRLGETASIGVYETLAVLDRKPGTSGNPPPADSTSKLQATFRGCFREKVAGKDDLVLKYDLVAPSVRLAINGGIEPFPLKKSVAISQRFGWLAYEDGPAGRLNLVEVRRQ